MKFDKILAISMAATMCVAFTACDSDDDDYVAAPLEQGAKVFFQPGNPTQISLVPEASSFDVKLSRTDASSAVSVPVSLTASKEGVFTIPATIDFAAGAEETTLTVAYDGTKLDYEEPVTLAIVIDPAMQTLYGVGSYEAKAMIPAPWKTIGMATYVEDLVTGFFSVENVRYEVEIQAHQLIPGFYRLVNPYGAAYPYCEPGDYDTTQDYYMEIHAEDPDKVWIPVATSGTDFSYGNFIFGSLAGYYINKGDFEKAEQFYGKLENGIITFPVDGMLVGMTDYQNGGLYTCNSNGAFAVALPGVVLADYSVELAYAGRLFDADDNLYVLTDVELSDDTEEAMVTICAKGQENDAIKAMLSGADEMAVTISKSGRVQLPFDGENPAGKYSIVAVGLAGGEAQCSSAAQFVWAGLGGAPAETWTPLFYGDWEYSVLFTEDEEGEVPSYDRGLVLSQSDNDPSRYMISDWCTKGFNLIFTMDDEGNCTVLEEQETGVEGSNGMIMIEELGLYAGTADLGWSYYADGVFHFNVIYYVSAGYYGYGFETFTLTSNYGAAPRQAAARGARAERKAPAKALGYRLVHPTTKRVF